MAASGAYASLCPRVSEMLLSKSSFGIGRQAILFPLSELSSRSEIVRLAPWIIGLLLCFAVLVPSLRWFQTWRALRPLAGPWDTVPFWYTLKTFWAMKGTLTIKNATSEFFTLTRNIAEEYTGKTFKVYLGMTPVVVLHTPDAVETLLTSNGNHRKPFLYDFLAPWLGQHCILTVTGNAWRFKRRLMTPVFHFRVLENYMSIFNEAGDMLVKRIGEFVKKAPNEAVPFFHNMQKCALDIIGQVTMGAKLHMLKGENNNFGNCFTALTFLIAVRAFRPWLWIQSLYDRTYEGKVFKKTVQEMEDFSYSVMRERRDRLRKCDVNANDGMDEKDANSQGRETVLLDALLRRHLQQKSYGLDEVKKDVDSIIFAGNDSTTSAVSWAFYLLGLHPNIQAKVQNELEDIFGDDTDREITTDDLKRMRYLECCLKESMRLYPPISLIGRVLDHDLVIDGHKIPRGVTCFVNIFSLHRNPDYFKNPEEYIPERFMSEEFAVRHPFSYIPFSGGAKNCLGQRFVMMEAKLLLAKVLSKFTIESTRPLNELKVTYEVILKARGGLRVWLRRRTNVESALR